MEPGMPSPESLKEHATLDNVIVLDLNGTADELDQKGKLIHLLQCSKGIFASNRLGSAGFVISTGMEAIRHNALTPEMAAFVTKHPQILGVHQVSPDIYAPNPSHNEGNLETLKIKCKRARFICLDDNPKETDRYIKAWSFMNFLGLGDNEFGEMQYLPQKDLSAMFGQMVHVAQKLARAANASPGVPLQTSLPVAALIG